MQNTIIRDLPFYKGVTKDLKSPQQKRALALTYAEGAVLDADRVDLDPSKICATGINFCRSIPEAMRWGPVVVEIRVPYGAKMVDTGDKLRAARVRVGPSVSLVGANLAGATLAGANLAGANLVGANLARSNLAGANLAGANLVGANLARANLAGANLAGANLAGANLVGANLVGANLARANLAGANLAGANLARANLVGATGSAWTVLPAGWGVSGSGIVRSK
jgi:uncharacterized protein YjbI with pentapeptide repeats